MMSKYVKFSIITVTFNAEDTIEKTMCSILNQTYNNYEYIIKDGNSKDKTNDIISSYYEKFNKKGIEIKHIVNDDKGIYDAMNQAIQMSRGEFVNFMNSGDVFAQDDVLEHTEQRCDLEGDVLYGDSICQYEFIKGKPEYTLWKGQSSFWNNMPFSHQACFFKLSIIKQYMYNIQYKSAADYDMLLRMFCDKKIFIYLNRIVSICTMTGVSNTNIIQSYRETIKIKQTLHRHDLLSNSWKRDIILMEIKQWLLLHLPYNIKGVLLRISIISQKNKIYERIEEVK